MQEERAIYHPSSLVRAAELLFGLFVLTGLMVPESPPNRFFADSGLALCWFDYFRGLEMLLAFCFSMLLIGSALFFRGTNDPLKYISLHIIKMLTALYIFILAVPASLRALVNENYRIYLSDKFTFTEATLPLSDSRAFVLFYIIFALFLFIYFLHLIFLTSNLHSLSADEHQIFPGLRSWILHGISSMCIGLFLAYNVAACFWSRISLVRIPGLWFDPFKFFWNRFLVIIILYPFALFFLVLGLVIWLIAFAVRRRLPWRREVIRLFYAVCAFMVFILVFEFCLVI